MTWLSVISVKFDVIILTECRTQNTLLGNKALNNMYPITGYNKFFTTSAIKYGGVMMYIKDCFDATVVPSCSTSNNLCDTLFVRISRSNSSI